VQDEVLEALRHVAARLGDVVEARVDDAPSALGHRRLGLSPSRLTACFTLGPVKVITPFVTRTPSVQRQVWPFSLPSPNVTFPSAPGCQHEPPSLMNGALGASAATGVRP
jgi:hypothetical protein